MRKRLFKRTRTGEYHFQFISDSDKTILNSQGYSTKDDRNTGIQSIYKNAGDANRYSKQQTDGGQYYFILRAANNAEIGRSPMFDSESETDQMISLSIAEIPKLGGIDTNPYDSDGKGDNYKRLSFYQERIPSTADGFQIFEAEGKFYFTYNANDAIYLISEGYEYEEGRDNGMKAVAENINNPDRIKPQEHPNGKSYFNLIASNNKEIATSIWFDNAAAMQSAIENATSTDNSQSDKTTIMEKNLDEYLDCKEYKGHPRSAQYPDFSTFEHDEEFYFAMLDEKDRVVLRSEGYKSENGRDNGIESVMKNREVDERFSVVREKGKSYVCLKAGNSQEIARSCPFGSNGAAQNAILGGGNVAAPKKKKKKRTTPKVPKVEVGSGSYPCSGISYKIFKSGNGKHYFTYRDKDDKAILISSNIRGYETLEETEAVIKAIATNGSKAGNFEERPTTNGKFYYYLKNDDGNNIGKSFFFDTEEEMRATMKLFDCGIAAGGGSGSGGSDRRDDDYLVCSAYEGHRIDGDGFSRFTNDNEYFFAMHSSDGAVRLRSERYTSESGRDNGIESVKKNRELSERYSIEEARNIFYVILKAGNHQEIGRSCPYTDRGAAESYIADPLGLIAAAAAKKAAEEKAAAEARAKAEAEAKAKADAEAAALAAAAAAKAKQDDYLRCSEYKGKETSSVHKDFVAFEQDGEYFFAWIGHNGEVILRSERYQSEKARDNGIESVLKNRKDQGKWSVDEKMGYYFNVLKAGNHQEIGRSCPMKDKGATGYNPTWFVGPLAAAEDTGVPVVVTKAKQDDYLKCAEYKGHKRSSIHKDFVAFEKDDEYFFAWIGKDGEVVLRSERYQSAKARDNGINSVLKNRKNEKQWSVDEKMGYYFSVLKAANHQEIGRSCPSKDKAAAGWNPLWFAAPAAAAVAAAVPKATPPPPPKKEKKVVAAAAEPAAAATSSGGFDWRWLLLLLPLLLLPFLCNKCKTEPAAVVPPVEATPPPPPPVEAAPPPPPAPVAAVCDCTNQTNKVFKLPPAGTTAKKLSRLGTNPEFGNSHSLDGAGFYNKLARQHRASGTDKRFLDGIFKAMGYDNGFADATAELFTEVELPVGTKGNLGYGRRHGTGYYTLPDASRDRQAFKIEAANGCHLHFMKTCGNHMFFCPN